MNILCTICGKPMQYTEYVISPGSNEPSVRVEPCCLPPETEERISYLEEFVFDELNESMGDLIGCVDNFMENLRCYPTDFYAFSVDARKEIEDSITTLNSRMKDLIKGGIK